MVFSNAQFVKNTCQILEPGVDFLKYLMDLYDVKYDINNRRKVLMPLWLKTMDYINCPCCKST